MLLLAVVALSVIFAAYEPITSFVFRGLKRDGDRQFARKQAQRRRKTKRVLEEIAARARKGRDAS